MQNNTEAEKFYQIVLKILLKEKIPFLVGGTYATSVYLDISRDTADFDIFCKAEDVQKILKVLSDGGYKTELADARWIAKIYLQNFVIDLIFGTSQGIFPVDESWFQYPHQATILDEKVRLIPPEEMICSKVFRQDRYRFEGPDINHLILKQGKKLNWKKILDKLEPFWEIFLAHLLNFRFVYPSEHQQIPRWVMEKLLKKLEEQMAENVQKEKVCRGTLLAIDPYKIDVEKWGFIDAVYQLQLRR